MKGKTTRKGVQKAAIAEGLCNSQEFKKRIDAINCEEELTPEKLRTFKGLENVSDERAEQIIRAIEKFTQITFRYFHSLKQQLYEK